MSLFVSTIGSNASNGVMSTAQIPSARTIDDRLSRAQADLIANMNSGVYNGPIDEERLMQAMYHEGPSPAEWAAQEAAAHQTVRDDASAYWDQKGKQAKDRWLGEPKRVSSTDSDSEAKAPSLGDLVQGTQLARQKDEEDEPRAPFAEVEPKKMTFLEAMKPAAIKKAYQNMVVDLRRWDELPQATALEKMQTCFLSSERVGAIVCSCILMIILITFVVILTM
jgi:hypothetical protein